MEKGGVHPTLLESWLVGRSLARELPVPVAVQGAFRVDTQSEAELRRWVFPAGDPRISVLGHRIANPREPIKACVDDTELADLLPSRWDVQATGHFMLCRGPCASAALPQGFVTRVEGNGEAGKVEITSGEGVLAARGYWGQAAHAFVYDRILVEPAYRRCGLGRALMGMLGQHRRDETVPQLLVATDEGRLLYLALGWEVLSPYSTAFWRPEGR
tara:strand:+ start:1176 stop:1820 length:645 start_codon:yes stop_codon:yes gene_type:complete